MPQKQTSVTLLLDPWQKMKKTIWGFNLSSRVQYRRWGLGWVLKWKLIQCEMGLEASPLELSETYHTQRNIWCRQNLGEEKPDMLFTQVAVDSTYIYCPLIIFVLWWSTNNLNNGGRTTAATLINNATVDWIQAEWRLHRLQTQSELPKRPHRMSLGRLKGLSTT